MPAEAAADSPAIALRRPIVGLGLRAPDVRAVLERRSALVAFLVYLAVTLFWFRSAVAHMGSACACGLPGDPAQYTWAFEWFPYALLHGLSLVHSTAMWTPTGVDMGGNAGVPFAAFLLWPVTALWGVIVTYNVVAIAAPVSAAWSAFLLCRYITKAPCASILGGASYGFSTYMIGQISGHPNLFLIFCPPLVLLSVLRFLHAKTSRRRLTIELTLLLLVQMFISTEVLFTMSVLGIVALAFAWALGDREQRARVSAALPAIAVAYLVMAVLSFWYWHPGLSAGTYAKDAGFLYYSTDLLSFFTPLPANWVAGATFAPVTALFQAGGGETDAYLGIVLLVVIGRYLSTHWASRATKLMAAMFVVTTLWVLGAHLYVAGKQTIWLPYSIVARLPVLNEVLQGRVAVYLALLSAIVLAMWVSSSNRYPIARWGTAVLAVALVVPNFVNPGTSYSSVWTNPVFYKTDMYKQYLTRGENVMPIAWGGFSESLMWQAQDHFYYNLASGYFRWSPPPGWQNELTGDLWLDTPKPGLGPLLRRFVIKHDVAVVAVQADELQKWSSTLRATGLRPSVTLGGVTLYPVPKAWRT